MRIEPKLVFAFEARVELGPSERIGDHGADLEFTPVIGGTIDGPKFTGTVVPTGGDWSIDRGSVMELSVRSLMRAADGALIDFTNRGYFRETEDGGAYFVTTPSFRTDAPQHKWLTESAFVGVAREDENGIALAFYEVVTGD